MKNFKLPVLNLIVGLFLAASLSHAGGSRVGNGNGSGNNGRRISIDKSYDIEFPVPFTTIDEFSDGFRAQGLPHIKMEGSLHGRQPILSIQKINFMKLRKERPDLVNISAAKFDNYFEKNKWQDVKTDNPCLKAHVIENPGTVTAIVAWGQDDGYVATTDNTSATKKALHEVIKSTRPYDKDCQWK